VNQAGVAIHDCDIYSDATQHLNLLLAGSAAPGMMAECGLSMVHTTIMRRVHHYAPEFERRWNRFARPVGISSRVDETHVKIRGQGVYLYRAVDREGNIVDFRLGARRGTAAVKAFVHDLGVRAVCWTTRQEARLQKAVFLPCSRRSLLT
jgi:DDE domain